MPKLGQDRVQRQVVEDAALADILHVQGSVGGEGVQEGVVLAIEIHRRHPETGTQLGVERRGRLHPPAVDVEMAVAVIDEQVRAAHERSQRFGLQMISDVGKPQ